MKRNILLLYSGGVDSTVLLHKYNKGIFGVVMFNYGSIENNFEEEKFFLNLKKFPAIKREVIKLDFFKVMKSCLFGNGESSLVPFRNGIFLSVGAGIAESLDIKNIMIGTHISDIKIILKYLLFKKGTYYPDCGFLFNRNIRKAVKYGTTNKVNLLTPFKYKSKNYIIKEGIKYGVDFNETYSCYSGTSIPCGRCEACLKRITIFKKLNIKY